MFDNYLIHTNDVYNNTIIYHINIQYFLYLPITVVQLSLIGYTHITRVCTRILRYTNVCNLNYMLDLLR